MAMLVVLFERCRMAARGAPRRRFWRLQRAPLSFAPSISGRCMYVRAPVYMRALYDLVLQLYLPIASDW